MVGKYYAVRNGRINGIYTTWEECKKQVNGYPKAQYKSFTNEIDANNYLNMNINIIDNNIKYVNIYTDGGCKNNGKENAIGGIGVFFGDNDERNISEKYNDDKITNNRCEIYAIIRALQSIADNIDVKIISDSLYTINSVTIWKKTNWNNVINGDLLSKLVKLIESRKGKTILEHVYGHKDNYGNIQADYLAEKAILY